MPKITSINLRRGTTTQWSTENPVLADGEVVWDSTVERFKVGDGVRTWSSIIYEGNAALAGKAPAAPIAEKSATDLPDVYPQGYSIMSVGSATGWPLQFSTVETVRQGANRSFQQLVNKTTGRVMVRAEGDTNTWGAWSESAIVGHTHTKADVGLSNVDNTTDAAKPISTATQTALNGKAATTHNHSASQITSGNLADARMPTRLNVAGLPTTDWNTAISAGWYLSLASSTANAPDSTGNWLGFVEYSGSFVTQTAHRYASDSSSNTHIYRRSRDNNNVWESWYKLQISQEEQDARYLQIIDRGAAYGVASLDGAGKIPSAQLPAAQIGTSLMGTYAQRPAATSTAAGTIYYATDTMESYRCDGSAWTVIAAGSELGSAELRSFYQSTGGGGQWLDLPGMAVTFVAGERPIKVELTLDFCVTVGNTNAQARLLINNTVSMTEISAHQAYSHKWDTRSANVRWYGLVTGNIHTIKTQVKADTGAEIWVDGSSTKTSLLTVSGV